MRRIFLCLFLFSALAARPQEQKVFTSDIDNFWIAYDSMQKTSDSLQQIKYIQTLYIDKGTDGLKAFMKARNYTAELWVQLVNSYPKFWNSVRPNTFAIKSKAKEIEASITKLKALYPELRPATMYFTIGGLRSGGTTSGDKVLVGTEIASADAGTDVSQFPNNWLANVFREQKLDNIIALNIHEYVHTQQKGSGDNLLAAAIREGSCDFITELVMGVPMPNNYIKYGRAHEAELKEQFKQEMFTSFYGNWLYNSNNAKTVADLGYFMGYTICKAYYNKAKNKKNAVEEIIELNYSNSRDVEKFLKESGYYTEDLDKESLIKSFESKQPAVVRLEPFSNNDAAVDPSLKELRVVFSLPMTPGNYSINYGKNGKESYPISGIVGYSDNNTVLTFKLDLKPAHEYEFVITDRSFRSAEGYPLKPLTVKFKTK
jgi:hypothetical protein